MNSGISHSVGPKNRRKQSRGGMSLRTVARQLGIDPKELGSQAEGLWKMMDDMAETDPQGYKDFIKTQAENAKEEEERGPSFTPTAGFVVKSFNRNERDDSGGRKKVFINICYHDAVGRPLAPSGDPVGDDVYRTDGIRIPLVVSETRQNEDSTATCVDVVFNTWVEQRVKLNASFKFEVINMSMEWVEHETPLSLEKAVSKPIRSVYKGGRGARCDQPIPFPVKLAKKQNHDGMRRQGLPVPDDEEVSHKSAQEEARQKLIDAAAAMSGEAKDGEGNGGSAGSALKDPLALLSRLRDSDKEEGGLMGSLNTSLSPDLGLGGGVGGDKVGPLIQELGPDGTVPESSPPAAVADAAPVTAPTPAPTGKKNKKKKPVVKKGFLNDAKESLYPKGSSEGGPKSFLDRCKVVDTTTMAPDEVEAAMRGHADGKARQARSGAVDGAPVRSAAAAAPSPAPARAPVVPTPAAAPVPQKSNKVTEKDHGDREFDSLMEAADGDMARFGANCSKGDDPEGFDSAVRKLWQSGMMSSEPPQLGGFATDPVMNEMAAVAAASAVGSGGGRAADAAVEDLMTAAAEAAVGETAKVGVEVETTATERPQYCISKTDGCVVVEVQLPLLTSLANVDLDISTKGMLLAERDGLYRLDVTFPSTVNEDGARAKFIKKRKVLKVTVPIVVGGGGV